MKNNVWAARFTAVAIRPLTGGDILMLNVFLYCIPAHATMPYFLRRGAASLDFSTNSATVYSARHIILVVVLQFDRSSVKRNDWQVSIISTSSCLSIPLRIRGDIR